MKFHLLACALGLFLAPLFWTPCCAAGDGEGKAEAAKASNSGSEIIIGKLKGLVVSATLKQAIGNFDSYSPIRIGDRIELDLDDLPVKRLELISAKADKEAHFLPLRAPLKIQDASQWSGGKSGVIHIVEGTAELPREFRISVVAQSLEKGSLVWVTIYVGGGSRFIGSMAEGEGVLK